MKINTTLTALFKDDWLIDESYVTQSLPWIAGLINGDASFDQDKPNVTFSTSLEITRDPWTEADPSAIDQSTIFRLDINGPILKYGGLCNYGTMDYVRWIEAADANESIAGILLVVDSPGGQASGVELLRGAIANSSKPVVVQITGMAASAAAYSIISADAIFASSEVDQFGSLGGMVSWNDYSDRLKAMGVKQYTVYAPQSTEKNIEAREAKKGNMEPLEQRLEYLIGVHHQAVMASRGLEGDGLPWMAGAMFFAEKAKELNLIDGIQPIDETLNYLRNLISNSYTSNSMLKFNKHPKLSALAGVAEADLTEEQLVEVNAELDEQKLEALRLVPASFVADADNAISEKNQAIKAKATAEAAQKKAEQERDAWKAKAKAYGEQPGATPTATPKKEETKVESGATTMISETDKQLMELQGKTFTVSE